jgi:hypothetical protein
VGLYDGLLDGVVADSTAAGLRSLETDVLMDTADARRRLAAQVYEFALSVREGTVLK